MLYKFVNKMPVASTKFLLKHDKNAKLNIFFFRNSIPKCYLEMIYYRHLNKTSVKEYIYYYVHYCSCKQHNATL